MPLAWQDLEQQSRPISQNSPAFLHWNQTRIIFNTRLKSQLHLIQGGPKTVIRCCLALIFYLNKKFLFCFLIMFIWTFRILLVKLRRLYRPNGRHYNWLQYGLVLWHSSSLRRELRATDSRIRVECCPWGLPGSRACSCKHGTSKSPTAKCLRGRCPTAGESATKFALRQHHRRIVTQKNRHDYSAFLGRISFHGLFT